LGRAGGPSRHPWVFVPRRIVSGRYTPVTEVLLFIPVRGLSFYGSLIDPLPFLARVSFSKRGSSDGDSSFFLPFFYCAGFSSPFLIVLAARLFLEPLLARAFPRREVLPVAVFVFFSFSCTLPLFYFNGFPRGRGPFGECFCLR